jgi:hypothetical protein
LLVPRQVEAGASLPSSGVRQLVVGLYGAGSAFASCAFAERLQSTGSVLARVVLPPAVRLSLVCERVSDE